MRLLKKSRSATGIAATPNTKAPGMLTSSEMIVKAINESFLESWLDFGRLPSAETIVTPEIALLSTNVHDPYLNAILQSITSEAFPVIDEYVNYFADKAVPFCWYTGPYTLPPDTGQYLQNRGLRFSERMTGMAMEVEELRTSHKPNLPFRLEKVTSASGMRIWAQVFKEGYGSSEPFIKAMLDLYLLPGTIETRGINYLCWIEDVPVATLTLVLHSNAVASIYDVATIPQYRKRGIATTVMLNALADAWTLGARLVVLQSTDQGLQLYKSIGFRTYCHFDCFVSDQRNRA